MSLELPVRSKMIDTNVFRATSGGAGWSLAEDQEDGFETTIMISIAKMHRQPLPGSLFWWFSEDYVKKTSVSTL
jgi:hypothetical protein